MSEPRCGVIVVTALCPPELADRAEW